MAYESSDSARNDRTDTMANRGAQETWPLIPFSEGPAVCPGRNLVLLRASAMIAAILDRGRVRLIDGRRLTTDRLPGTLNHFRLRFEIVPRA